MHKRLVTVRRPGARIAPINRSRACRQERWTKSGANARMILAKWAGRSGMGRLLAGTPPAYLPRPLVTRPCSPAHAIGQSRAELDFGQFGRGPGEALACDETVPAEFYYIPAAPGHAEKSGNARVGPSARAIIAAYDGHEGRLALPWEMRKARPTPPIGAAPACPANSKPEVPGHTAAHCI